MEDIQEAGAVGAELLTGKLAPCVRMWTRMRGSGVKESAAQHIPMLVNLGKLGDHVRGREQKQGFIW